VGEEAGVKTTETMDMNRVEGRRSMGKVAIDSDARYLH